MEVVKSTRRPMAAQVRFLNRFAGFLEGISTIN
jgi:hypothetical protein